MRENINAATLEKKRMIAVDGGSTNTRFVLMTANGKLIKQLSLPVGARDTAHDGHNRRLNRAIREGIEELGPPETGAPPNVIVAAGMITSNLGLYELPHLAAPTNANQLAQAMRAVSLPQAAATPIWFVPGIKNFDGTVTTGNISRMDMMRGEETECAALIQRCHTGQPLMLVLPGSHTKFVAVDAQARITGCLTSLSGELLDAMTNHTVIADAVGRGFVDEDSFDRTLLFAGCRQAAQTGLGRAAFSVRILNQLANFTHGQAANYLLGAVLASDLLALKDSALFTGGPDRAQAVVAGRGILCRALAELLAEDGLCAGVTMVQPDGERSLSAQGAYLLAKMRGLIG